MKVRHLENGNLVITQGSHFFLVILGIAAFLFLAKDAFLWIFTEESTSGNKELAISIIVLTILFFYRVWSLTSEFRFDNVKKRVEYHVQYPFSNKRGIIPINQIQQALVETDTDGASRIIIRCNNQEIPMSAAVKNSEKHSSACDEINQWLERNTW